MATIKCPSNVTSLTFAVSGVKVPDAAFMVSGLTSLEATAFTKYSNQSANKKGVAKLQSSASNGNLNLLLPSVITAITIAGTSYNVNGAVTGLGTALSASVPAAAGTTVLNENFSLVQG